MVNRRTGRNLAYGLGYLLLALVGAGLVGYEGDRDLALLFGSLLLLIAVAGFVMVGFDWWYPAHRPGITLATAPSGRPATAILRSPVPTALSVVVPVVLALWALFATVTVDAMAARVVFALIAVGLLTPLVAVARGRIAPGGLYVTSAGVEQRKEAVSWSIPWESLAGVLPTEPLALTLSGPVPERTVRTRVLWQREPSAPNGVVAVDSRYLAADRAVVAAVIGRCLADPVARERMGTPEMVEEIRAGLRRPATP